MAEVESIVEDLAASDGRIDQTAVMSSVLQLAHRDLVSAQALVFRASLAQGGVFQRVLGAVLGRPLVDVSESETTAAHSPQINGSDGSLALDPFRAHLADSAVEIERLFKSLSAIRLSMVDHEVEKEIDIPEWPDPVINFAGGMVDGAIENLDEARQLLYGASDLTEDRLVHLWAERMVGTPRSREESKS